MIGPTNKYPQGKLNEQDKGGLSLAIFTNNDKIILEFGISVSWIGFDADQARSLAEILIHKADAIQKKVGE